MIKSCHFFTLNFGKTNFLIVSFIIADLIFFLIAIVAVLVGEEITATNANHIQVANMDTATGPRGNVSAIPIGEEFYAIKVTSNI